MNKKKENFDIVECLYTLAVCYSPLDKRTYIEYLSRYFPSILEKIDEDILDIYLEAMTENKMLYKDDDYYSALDFDFLDHGYESNIEFVDYCFKEGDLKFDGKELLNICRFEKAKGIKEVDDLKAYLSGLKQKSKDMTQEELISFIFHCLYSYLTAEAVVSRVMPNEFVSFEQDEALKYLKAYADILPRPFYRGRSYRDKDEFYQFHLNVSRLKEFPPKANYPSFTYKECMNLAKKIDKMKAYRMIDSDRLLEFTINGKEVYVSVLGFYGNDFGMMIYPNKEALCKTYPYMFKDIDDYPDLPYRIDVIEVCLDDIGGFGTKEILDELKALNYPEIPSFVRMEANRPPRLINAEEANLVGAVFSELINLVKLSNLSDIVNKLGERKENDFDITQVYVAKDEVLFGGYNDPLIFEVDPLIISKAINKAKIKKVKQANNKLAISIGLYVLPCIVDNFLPYILIIYDDDTNLVIDISLKKVEDLNNLTNDLLAILLKKDICPLSISVNNEYTYSLLSDLDEYFEDIYISKMPYMNEIYEIIKNDDLLADNDESEYEA